MSSGRSTARFGLGAVAVQLRFCFLVLTLSAGMVLRELSPTHAQSCPPTDLGKVPGVSVRGTTHDGSSLLSASCGGDAAPEAAFVYTAPVTGSYRIDTFGSNFLTVLYARDGSCTGAELGCASSFLTLQLLENQQIVIVVDGAPGFSAAEGGNFTLTVLGPSAPGRIAFVANDPVVSNAGSISVIDMLTNVVTDTIPLTARPRGVALTRGGLYAYISARAPDSVLVLDTGSKSVKSSVSIGPSPEAVVLTPDGTRAYVTNLGGDSVSVISTDAALTDPGHAVVATIKVGHWPKAIALSPDGAFAYVANFADDTISVLDTQSNSLELPPIGVGSSPAAIAVSPNGDFVYVVNSGMSTTCMSHGSLFVIATSTRAVVGLICVGDVPSGIAVDSDGLAYVTSLGDNSIALVDPGSQSGAALSVAHLSQPCSAVAVTPDGQFVYVTGIAFGPDGQLGDGTVFASNEFGFLFEPSGTRVGTSPVSIAIGRQVPTLLSESYQGD